jgi:transcriptional regulator with XRE-family HTH domain
LLVQFRTMSGSCRKCRTPLDEEPEPEPTPIVAPPPTAPEPRSGHLQVATSIRALRQRANLSQRQLALRMKVPRTYVSKIENEKATPTLSSLERLANALEVTVPELLAGGCSREREIRDLMADEFIAEMVPYITQLNGMQWSSLLTQMREMATRVPRTT